MQFRNLKVFCDVVARHSFSKAAEENGMTQSGASQAVQQLEDYLQVQLLDRSKRPFVLTPEGRVFYAGCGKLVRQFETLAEEVRSLGQEISGRVTIAAIYSAGLSYLPDLQRQLKQRFPKAELRFQFGHPDEVYRAVEQGTADFGLVSYPQQSKTIQATHWREEEMVLAAPAHHPLATRDRVTPEDLGLESLVAFASNLRIRHEIDRYLRSIGIAMQVAAELDNIDSVKHAIEINSAVAFLPRPAIAEELDSGSLVALPCVWLSMQRPLGIIERRDGSLGPAARAFWDLLFELAGRDEPASAGSADTPPDAADNVDNQLAARLGAGGNAVLGAAAASAAATRDAAERQDDVRGTGAVGSSGTGAASGDALDDAPGAAASHGVLVVSVPEPQRSRRGAHTRNKNKSKSV
jgi:DNA-binding transcriptional LysR family regulator